MKQIDGSLSELDLLLELLCEDRLTAAEQSKLEQLVLSSPDARWKFLTYMDLHGTLYWDAAGAGSAEPFTSLVESGDRSISHSRVSITPQAKRFRYPQIVSVVAACLVLLVTGVWRISQLTPGPKEIAKNGLPDEKVAILQSNRAHRSGPPESISPVTLGGNETADVPMPERENESEMVKLPISVIGALPPASVPEVVAKINEEIQSGWTALGLQPSPRSDDFQWMRRIYLDLFGRIPSVHEVDLFLADKSEKKREELVERLLGDSTYVRNFTTKWTNLLIGRAANSQVNRDSFQKFLRMSFAENRPWNQVVSDLISAEGNNSENGAANFLIAHLNNDATPATAIVSKMFLGRQVQCNQCHNNPFDESKQLAFWEMNSFFQQTAAVSRQRRDSRSGRLDYVSTELVTQDVGGPTYFESQWGLMRVAYPNFNGRSIDPSPDTNRRRELARLMTAGDQPQLAASFINRMWEHFFGYGFTHNVDDMGSHQPTSHPELLSALSDQFIRCNYDVKQLIRWICLSDAYQLSSNPTESNESDDPSLGELPAFSHKYVRTMTAEQTYDSFLTATKAHHVGAVDWSQSERNRQEWLKQFVVAFHTDENDETMTFEGSLGNALAMMNGPLIEKALDLSPGSFLGEVIRRASTDVEKIRQLCQATWSRNPTSSELASLRKLIREATRGNRESSAYQDLFWALLNSNEFVLSR